MKRLTPLVFFLAALCIFSPDKELFAISSALLLFLVRFSWREDEPKIIFLGMVFYWLTVCTLLLYGIFFNKPLIELTGSPDTFILTTYLSLLATFFYCAGLLIAIKNITPSNGVILIEQLKIYSPKKLLIFYSLYSFFSSLFSQIALSLGGFSQIGVGIIWMKWAFLTILIIHTLLFRENQKWVYIVLIIEVVLSFGGFWSDFKDYLFIAAASFLTFSSIVNVKRLFQIGVLAFAAFFFMVLWTVVKGDYRKYLTGGEQTLVVKQQSTVENLRKLSELVEQNFGAENFSTSFSKGVEDLSHRVSYTEYFAMAVGQVPSVLPYENGALLMAGLEHVFKPRLFFPNKKSIDDSEMTSKYTGRRFSGASQGASFSLGLVAERYIDYGPVGMFIPIFLLGYLIGVIYKFILKKSFNRIWGLAFVAPLFFFIPNLGIPTTKFLGWLLTYFIVWGLFNKYAMQRLDTFLRS